MILISHRAREVSIFAKPKHKAPIVSQRHFGGGDVEIVSATSRDFYYPRESFRHISGGKWWPWLASYWSPSSLASFEFARAHSAREWSSLGTRHFSLHPTRLAEPRVFHYLSREYCSKTRVSDRRAKRTHYVLLSRQKWARTWIYFSKYI